MSTTLITGGTGKTGGTGGTGGIGRTGRRVARLLTDMKPPVEIGSRSGHVRLNWNEPSTFEPALEGCHSAYPTSAPDLAFPGAAELIGQFAAAAVAAGTSRLVLLSGRGEVGAQQAARLLIDSGAWTVVRCAFFAQSFSKSAWVDAIRSGRLELPGDTTEPVLDADDIAVVVAEALLNDRHLGQLYELTGPRLLTFAEAVQEIIEATGRDMQFEKVTRPRFAAGLHASGMPTDEARSVAELFTEVLDGHNAHLSDAVRRALARSPRDVGDYVRRTAQTGVRNG